MVSPQILFHDEGEQFQVHVTQRHELGQVMWLPDGRAFRYARAGGSDIAVARLCQATVMDADLDELAVAAAEPLLNTDGTANQSLGLTLGSGEALIADDLKEGFVAIEDDAGEGYLYKVSGHSAAEASALATINLHPHVDLQVALTTSTTALAMRNQYRDVILHPAPWTAFLVGITVRVLPAGQYGWLAVLGPCMCLTEGTLVAGSPCIPSATADGAVAPATAATEPVVGHVISVSATTEHSVIHARLI
jgi:hypothetical protein